MLPIFGSIRKLNSSQLADFCCKRRPQDYERIAAIGLDDLDVSAFEPGMQFAEAVARHLTSTEGHAEVGAGVSATAYYGCHAGDGPSHARSSRPHLAIDTRRFSGSAFELMDTAFLADLRRRRLWVSCWWAQQMKRTRKTGARESGEDAQAPAQP